MCLQRKYNTNLPDLIMAQQQPSDSKKTSVTDTHLNGSHLWAARPNSNLAAVQCSGHCWSQICDKEGNDSGLYPLCRLFRERHNKAQPRHAPDCIPPENIVPCCLSFLTCFFHSSHRCICISRSILSYLMHVMFRSMGG
jgi:hypothetical protein